MDIDPKSINQNEYVDNDTKSADLNKKSLRSGLITFGAQPIKLAIGIGSTALLARLLTPADFGLLAMVSPLLLLADSLTNLGLETATIKQDKLDHQLMSAVFWLSLQINALVIGLMVLMAPVIAWFFKRSELSGITLVLALGVLSLCLSYQHQSLLKRQMSFGTLTIIEVGALLAGGVTAVVVALLGWGYWALVLQVVVMQLAQSIAYWLFCPWRPEPYVQGITAKPQFREMLNFGIHLTGFRFLTRVGMQLDRILIGYIGGATTLGLYQVAYKWAYFSFEQIYFPLFDVSVSTLSRVYQQPESYKSYGRRSLSLLFSLCMPALAFSFVAARDLLLLLLGKQWLEIVPLFQVLTVAVFFTSLYRVTKWLYVSAGQTQRQFRWGLIYTFVMVTGIAIGSIWGAKGVAIGYTLATCLITYPSVAYCLKTSPLSLGNFFNTVWRPALASVLSAGVLYAIQFALPNTDIILFNLLLKFAIFGLTYLLVWILIPGGRNITTELFNVGKRNWQNKK
jgi:O-antigen/teichoic acid export membrane protein